MRVVLVQPPVQDFYDTDVRLQPIGLAYIKAAVRKHLPDVDILIRDYHHQSTRQTLAIPPELKYLRDYYENPDKSPFSAFHQYYHFGWSFDRIIEDLIALKPDVVGISSLFSPYYREVLTIAAEIKKRLKTKIILGGSHVSAMPEQMLSSPHVDYVIKGEGEKAFVEFLEFIRGQRSIEQVSNLGYKINSESRFNSAQENFPLDEIPTPDLSDFSLENYQFQGEPMTFMITSRSCPHRCTFCSVHTTFGNNYRRRNLDSIISEIQQRYNEGYRVIDFEDDNLTFFKKEMKELCLRLIEMFPKRDLRLVAMNGISYISLDEELLELMARAGFTHLNLALVSSDKLVRESTKRPHTIDAYLRVVKKATELNLHVVSYQILGLPTETLDSMIQTMAFNAGLPVLMGASMFYLTPSSPIAKAFPKPETTDVIRSRLTAMAIESEHFQRADIYTLFVATRIINFLKGLPITEDLDLTSVLEKKFTDSRINLGLSLLRYSFTEQKMFQAVNDNYVENKNFRWPLWQSVLEQIDIIKCQNKMKIMNDINFKLSCRPPKPNVVKLQEKIQFLHI